jgi:hypothetical protein
MAAALRAPVYRPREEGADEDSTRWVTGLHQRHGYRDVTFISRRLCDAFKLVCVEAPPAAQLANFAEARTRARRRARAPRFARA